MHSTQTHEDVHSVYKDGKLKNAPKDLYILSILQELSQKNPNKDAIVFTDVDTTVSHTMTYRQLYSAVLSIAYTLQKTYGVKQGDSVALNLHNTSEILLFHFACWIMGCITVPLDLKRDDTQRKIYKISETHSNVFVCKDEQESLEEFEKIKAEYPHIQKFVLPMEMPKEFSGEQIDVETLSSSQLDTCLTLFTSGTTALPKGVELSMGNLILNAMGIKEWLQITPEDKFHIVLPLHHINSTTMSLATILAGGTIILSSRYSKSKFWDVMANYRCTLSSIVPTICFDLLSEQEAFIRNKKNLQQVSRIQIGSAPVQPSDVQKFFAMYHIRLIQGYGSTETALRVTGVDVTGLSDDQYKEVVERNTIGSELAWNNVTVLTPEGQEVKEKEEGEICIRGPVLTKGYIHNEKANKESFMHGWFYSGDLGYWSMLYGKKVFFINGRRKEIIIKGGVNISPLAVEHAILKHYPTISTCYVAAYPEHRYGEDVAVVVAFDETVSQEKRKQTMEQFRKDCTQATIKGVSAYETPQVILEVPLETLPATSTGKVQRVNIKTYLQDMFTPIAETKQYMFRKLTPFDTHHIKTLVDIHNTRWGKHLGIDEETANKAVLHGIVIGAIDRKTQELCGSIFAQQVKSQDAEKIAEWMKTYNKATGSLTLLPSTADGNALLLVSVSTQGKQHRVEESLNDPQYKALLQKAPKYIQQYLSEEKDPVLRFHMKPKCGLERRARILHVLERARPEDIEAMGYNVILQYPELAACTVTEGETLGTQLVESTLVYALHNKMTTVYAYSRPSGFKKWLELQ